jgi:tRNA(Ile)-lysidine synthase
MREQFLEAARRLRLSPSGKTTLLAVSGGIDSVVLCDLFSQAGFPFAVAHAHFGLRGKSSDADERFVVGLAKRLGADCYTARFDTRAFARTERLSVQEAARNLRYAWFAQLRKAHGFRYIATAHHVDDNVETFFINLLRGTGTVGLRGIPPKNGPVIRPLLGITRKQVEAYARARGLRWREDASNDSDDYLRNRIRHHLVPLLEELQPALDAVMRGNLDRFREATAFLEQAAAHALQPALSKKQGTTVLDLSRLDAAHRPWLAFQALKEYGFTRAQADAAVSGSGNRAAGRRFQSDSHLLVADRGRLLIRKEAVKASPSRKITSRSTSVSTGTRSWSVRRSAARQFSVPPDAAVACLDAGLLSFPLTVRTWRPGDAFRPLGMKGRKKISDFLTDKKLPLFEKEHTFVVVSGEDVICVLGHRIDDRYKVSAATRNILVIEPIPS